MELLEKLKKNIFFISGYGVKLNSTELVFKYNEEDSLGDYNEVFYRFILIYPDYQQNVQSQKIIFLFMNINRN
jgi:hypothetical protein